MPRCGCFVDCNNSLLPSPYSTFLNTKKGAKKAAKEGNAFHSSKQPRGKWKRKRRTRLLKTTRIRHHWRQQISIFHLIVDASALPLKDKGAWRKQRSCLLAASMVCKQWNAVACDASLWRTLHVTRQVPKKQVTSLLEVINLSRIFEMLTSIRRDFL